MSCQGARVLLHLLKCGSRAQVDHAHPLGLFFKVHNGKVGDYPVGPASLGEARLLACVAAGQISRAGNKKHLRDGGVF